MMRRRNRLTMPNQIDIEYCLKRIIEEFPYNYVEIIKKIHERQNQQNQVKEEQLSKYEPTVIQDSDTDQDRNDNKTVIQQEKQDIPQIFPSFTIKQKPDPQFLKPTPTKYEVQQQFIKAYKQKQLKLPNSIYDRFGGMNKQRIAAQKTDKNYEELIDSTINNAMLWKQDVNKEYRIYASKVAPKFRSIQEETRYYEKRLAAKAFCQRGYGLNKVHQEYFQNGGPVRMQKKRYKTVSTAFINDSYRRFQSFLIHDMRKSIRALSGPQMRSLYSILLNAQSILSPTEYHCFRKCVKVAFDLGSVSIYEQDAVSLFIAIQHHLKQKIIAEGVGNSNNGKDKDNKTQIGGNDMVSVVRGNNRLVNIYAPIEGGGYQEKTQMELLDQAGIIDQEVLAGCLEEYESEL